MAENDENEHGNGFLKLLQEHNKGRIMAEAGQDLAEVIEAVMRTGKKGNLKLTLNFEPVKKNFDDPQIVVSHEIATKKPKPATNSSVFFGIEGGGLSRIPSNQRDWVEEQEQAAAGKTTNPEAKAQGE